VLCTRPAPSPTPHLGAPDPALVSQLLAHASIRPDSCLIRKAMGLAQDTQVGNDYHLQ
jgi:hypothetical protein